MSAQATAQNLIAYLRHLSWLELTAHWTCSGTAFYGDHELLQRLYEETNSEVDPLAERCVAEFGPDVVDLGVITRLTLQFAAAAQESFLENPFECLRTCEQGLLEGIGVLREELESEGLLSAGFDNMLAGFAEKHESHLYLLGQRQKASKTAADELGDLWFKGGSFGAERFFFDNPLKRETREFAESKALTNLPGAHGDNTKAPDTPVEIRDKVPGGAEFSTLSRHVVKTEEPVKGVPNSWGGVDKHPVLAGWRLTPALEVKK